MALACSGTALLALYSCYTFRPSEGGGEIEEAHRRTPDPRDVMVPDGYRIEPVATGLSFPTGITFDGQGRPYVTESGYSYGEVFTTARLLRLEPDGRTTVIATSDNPPWNGVVHHQGAFYVAEGGVRRGGRILRIDPDGTQTALVEGLPSFGDHHTNGPAIGPDGDLYFGQGTATNSAVVGTDNFQFGWLARHPEFHDVPCRDVKLTGQRFETEDPLSKDGRRVSTSPYHPFGRTAERGQVVPGRVPCSGAVMKVGLRGGPVELVAWGFRNPFGLAFAPDGQLYVTDNGYDNRGSRPVFGAADVLWRVEPGTWYGWPDYAEGRPVGERYEPPKKDPPEAVLLEHPNEPPKPAAFLAVSSSSDGLDFSRNHEFGFVGHAFIAQFGDQAPITHKVFAPVGFKVVRVNPATGEVADFATNAAKTNAPASSLGRGGLERPLAARFHPDGRSLWIVDFGVMMMDEKGAKPVQGTGMVWRILRGESSKPLARERGSR